MRTNMTKNSSRISQRSRQIFYTRWSRKRIFGSAKYKSNNRSEPQRTKETIQRAYNAPQKVVESNKEQQTKKKSLLRRLKEFFTGNIVKSDDVELIAVIEESAHKKFENEVSQNGRLKGCTDHVIKEKDYEKSNIEREEQTEEKTR